MAVAAPWLAVNTLSAAKTTASNTKLASSISAAVAWLSWWLFNICAMEVLMLS